MKIVFGLLFANKARVHWEGLLSFYQRLDRKDLTDEKQTFVAVHSKCRKSL